MRQRPNLDEPLGWLPLLFLLVLLGLFAAEVFVNYQPVKLTALLVALFWVPLLVLHETGHAVVTALLGWRVHRVVLGMGRTLWRLRVGDVPVEVRTFPVEGFVQPSPRNLRSPRLKSALIYFAGPGSELLLVLLIALVVGPATLLSYREDIGLLIVQSLCIAALASAILNLIPHLAITATGEVANDGLGILRSFTRPLDDFAAMVDPTLPRQSWERDPDWWRNQ
jgi:hypothetical protein